MFPGFDGLMTLSRREGVDIRPTLLRVITDLYVQTERHTAEEERQFVELTSRLIEQVDEPTRAMVRSRLAVYAQTPASVAHQLSMSRAPAAAPPAPPPPAQSASDFSDGFFEAAPAARLTMLQGLADTPPPAAMRPTYARAARALVVLEAAAFAADVEGFIAELSTALLLPISVAARVVSDAGGEPLACAAKALDMPSDVFQRVLMFLDRSRGASVPWVYRLSRLYDVMTINAARNIVASWRGASFAQARARHQSALHDDERHRLRATASERPTLRPSVDLGRTSRHSRN